MTKPIVQIGIAILPFCLCPLQANPPSGWVMAGSKPTEYDANIDPQTAYAGQPSVHIKSIKPPTGFGSMLQCFRGEQYLGKRIRFSANVKSAGIDEYGDWAGLWYRADKGTQWLAFDNMQDRPIKGASAWRNYEVVLDIPHDSTGSCFGILLAGSGSVWINSVKLEVVSINVPVTGHSSIRAMLSTFRCQNEWIFGCPMDSEAPVLGRSPRPEGPKNLGFDK